MSLLKQPINVVLKDRIACLQLSGWIMFGVGVLTIAIELTTASLSIGGVLRAVGDGTTALVFGAWMLNMALWQGRAANLEKENTELRTRQA